MSGEERMFNTNPPDAPGLDPDWEEKLKAAEETAEEGESHDDEQPR